MFRAAEMEYVPLVPDDEPEDEKVSDLYNIDQGRSCPWCRRESRHGKAFKISMTVVVLFLVYLLGFASNVLMDLRGPQSATTYSTDWKPAREAVELEKVRFMGSALFDDEGEPYFDDEDRSPYMGTPTKAIDQAWSNLIKRE